MKFDTNWFCLLQHLWTKSLHYTTNWARQRKLHIVRLCFHASVSCLPSPVTTHHALDSNSDLLQPLPDTADCQGCSLETLSSVKWYLLGHRFGATSQRGTVFPLLSFGAPGAHNSALFVEKGTVFQNGAPRALFWYPFFFECTISSQSFLPNKGRECNQPCLIGYHDSVEDIGLEFYSVHIWRSFSVWM